MVIALPWIKALWGQWEGEGAQADLEVLLLQLCPPPKILSVLSSLDR
jgi:hypothetical protein